MCESIGLAGKLAALLRDREMKPEDLARAVQCPASTVTQWLNGKFMPSSRHLRTICETLDCSADDLLGVEVRKPEKVNKALALDLYAAITARGVYNSESIHQMATAARRAKGNRITTFELWLREIAEAVYKVELTKRRKPRASTENFQLRLF